MKKSTSYLLVALAGLAGGFAFAPLKLGFVAFFSFVPLIMVLESRRMERGLTPLLYLFFFCFHGAANWWVMSWQKETDPFLMAAGAGLWLGHPFFLMPAFWVYHFVRKRSSITLSLSVLVLGWTAVEWLHSLSDLSYPWLALGYTQVYSTALIQIADLGGVWIVSMFVMSINAIIAHYALAHSSVWKHLGVATAIILVVSLYGIFRLETDKVEQMAKGGRIRRVTVGLVQPSINPWEKWQGGINDMISQHQHLQDSLNRLQHCDLCVWSETAVPYGLKLPENISLRERLQTWSDTSGSALLTGFADYQLYPKGSAPDNAQRFSLDPGMMMKVYNSAGIFNPGRSEINTHHKSRLTPFGEYMPFSDDVPLIQSWLKWGVGISGWNKGEGATVLALLENGKQNDTLVKIGPVICIESIYPNYVAEYSRKGAELLAVITNDAWYDGTFGPEQHYCISRLRAVETRTPIVRCGNSGISGLIDACGRSVAQAPARERCSFLVTTPKLVPHPPTVYAQFGDWLPMLCTLLSASAMLWVGLGKRTNNNEEPELSGDVTQA